MIRIKGREEAIPSSPAISILNLLQRNGIAIQTICGGRAQCGRCVIRVIEGAENMNRKNQRELIRLQALNAGEEMRLACQSYTRGDIQIEIINSGTRPDDQGG
jgi:ferredoxin